MGDGTHLDLSRRKVITRLLEDNKTAKEIGMIISLDLTNVENINGQLRLFIDKKADISNMTQEQAYELASHMNSRILESLGASTPVDAFIEIFGEDILTKLHLRKIDKKAVAPKKVLK